MMTFPLNDCQTMIDWWRGVRVMTYAPPLVLGGLQA
nr:MAG TPA: hypothetical protein [Caudoviricetes sp.]